MHLKNGWKASQDMMITLGATNPAAYMANANVFQLGRGSVINSTRITWEAVKCRS